MAWQTRIKTVSHTVCIVALLLAVAPSHAEEDEAIWDMVAFLQRMPALSPEQYLALVESSNGHVHAGPYGHDHSDRHAH